MIITHPYSTRGKINFATSVFSRIYGAEFYSPRSQRANVRMSPGLNGGLRIRTIGQAWTCPVFYAFPIEFLNKANTKHV